MEKVDVIGDVTSRTSCCCAPEETCSQCRSHKRGIWRTENELRTLVEQLKVIEKRVDVEMSLVESISRKKASGGLLSAKKELENDVRLLSKLHLHRHQLVHHLSKHNATSQST